MSSESPLTPRAHGASPVREGWFVVNAADAAWSSGPFGAYTGFEGEDSPFPQVGVNLTVLTPGQSNCYYHAETRQEDFLVLDGECLALLEDEERRLRRWDFVHCPSGTAHVFVATGDRPCLLLGVGARGPHTILYPDSELARRHQAGVTAETDDPATAYAGVAPDAPVPFDPGWLAGPRR